MAEAEEVGGWSVAGPTRSLAPEEAAAWSVAGPTRPEEKKKTPTFGSEMKAVGSHIMSEGVAGTLGLPADALGFLVKNRLIGPGGDIMNIGLKALGLPPSEVPFLGSDSIRRGMREIGMIQTEDGKDIEPESLPGRIAAKVGSTGISAVGGGGLLGSGVRSIATSPKVAAFGRSLADPLSNLLAGIGGGLAGMGGKAVAGKPGEIAGEILGGGLTGALAGSVKRLRPPTPRDPVLDAYETLGLYPSAAEQGIGGKAVQWLQGNVLPQTVGGSNIMENFKQGRLSALAKFQEDIVASLGGARPRPEAGKAIQESVQDTWRQMKTQEGILLEGIKAKYGHEQVVAMNFVQAAANPIGTKNVSKNVAETIIDPLVQEARQLVTQNHGVFTVADLAGWKSKIGRALEPGPQKNVNDAQIKQLYDAINKDIGTLLQSVSPKDHAIFEAAKRRYGQAEQEFTQHFAKLVGTKDAPVSAEKAFEIVTGAATEKGRGNLEQFKHVWDAMPPTERGSLAATILGRLGSTDKGDLMNPDKFSMGAFLKGYGDLSSEARRMMFQANPAQARELDALVAVYNNIQEKMAKLASSSRSGTVNAFSAGQFGLGYMGSALSHGDLTGFLYAYGGPAAMAALLTKPWAVKSLAATLRSTERALDGSLRAALDLNMLPPLPVPPQTAAPTGP